MEDTMSSYSFSHQFYQRWTCAPEPIRNAIIQELTDITILLQADTSFKDFVFNFDDLDAHLDTLYNTYDAEQVATKVAAEKQVQSRAAAEKQHLEEQEQKKRAAEKEVKRQQEADALQQEKDKNEQLAADKKRMAEIVANTTVSKEGSSDSTIDRNSTDKSADSDKDVDTASDLTDKHENQSTQEKISKTNDHNIKAITDRNSLDEAINLSLKDAKLSATHQDLIRELEMHVDDYLSEQMTQMSENLKSWLRAEVTQHLTEQGQSVDSLTKKNSL